MSIPGGQPWQVALYCSTNATVDARDVWKASYLMGPLAAGDQHTETLSFSAPTTGGTYYLAAVADSSGAIAELSEGNNWGQVITLHVLYVAPDLTAAIEGPANILAAPGERVQLQLTMRNVGLQDCPARQALPDNHDPALPVHRRRGHREGFRHSGRILLPAGPGGGVPADAGHQLHRPRRSGHVLAGRDGGWTERHPGAE